MKMQKIKMKMERNKAFLWREIRFNQWLMRFFLILIGLMIFTNLLLATPPFAEDHADRLTDLYKKQVFFNTNGQPQISVAISEHQFKVQIKIDQAVRVYLGGSSHDHLTINLPTEWTVQIDESIHRESAKIEHCIILEQFSSQDQKQIPIKKEQWTQKIAKPLRLIEAGAIVGLSGKMLDTKTYALCQCGIKNEEQLKKEIETLEAQFDQRFESLVELLQPPKGDFIAIEKNSGLSIHAKDLIWFSPIITENQTDKPIIWLTSTKQSSKTITRAYEGDIYLTMGADGLMTAVNEIDAETLLKGVVPTEIYTHSPQEALKAQAIVARGHLMSKAGMRHRADPFLFCAEVHCQAYTGIEKRTPQTDLAVELTRGQLLFDEDQKLVDSVYSSTCGGHTEDYHLMWGGLPQKALMGKRDQISSLDQSKANEIKVDQGLIDGHVSSIFDNHQSFCSEPKHTYRWQEKLKGSLLSNQLKKHNIGSVYGIEVIKRGRSGRAIDIKYHGTKGVHIVRGSYQNRLLLGKLKSGLWRLTAQYGKNLKAYEPQAKGSDFNVKEPTNWIFDGAGYGHGVGMCQHGALQMSKQNYKVDQILSHYYTGSKIIKIW
jgi:stage II sporulation protein D